MSELGLEGCDLGCQLGNVLFSGHSEVLLLLMLRVSRLKLSSTVRACLRPGMYHVLVLTELRRICGIGTQGDRSLLNALSRKCYMHMLQYVHRGLYLEQKMRRKLSSHFAQVLLYITNR